MELQQLLSRAARLASNGALREAETLLQQVDDDGFASPSSLLLASSVKLQLDRYRAARGLAIRAADCPGPDEATLLQLARLLRRFEAFAELEQAFDNDRIDRLRSLPVLAELVLLLSSAGAYGAARQAARRLLRLDPRSADGHYLKALLDMFEGLRDDSLESLQRALATEPRMPNAHWLVAMQGDRATAAEHVTQMLRVLPGIVPGTEAQAYLLYSLHHRLHSLGRHAEAWYYLRHGREVMRRLAPYDRAESHRVFDALKGMRLPVAPVEPPVPGVPGLIFIVGMFRSGTTLIERALGGHPDVMDGGETYQFTAAMREAADHDCHGVIDTTLITRAAGVDFALVRERMRAFAAARSQGRRWLTEKLPSNFLNIGFILRALPDARILHLTRDPMDTCFSNLRTIFRGAATYASDQEDLGDYFVRYRDLMAHWHAIAPGRILDVDYADFVRDPEGQAARIFGHCGLAFEPRMLDAGQRTGHAPTASAAHVRQGVLPNRHGAWRPYDEQLAPLRRVLGDCVD